MTFPRMLARPMLAAPFIADGVGAMVRPQEHVEKVRGVQPVLEKAGAPPALFAAPETLVRATGAVTAVAGIFLATSRTPRTAALTLVAIGLPTAVVRNPVWRAKDKEERRGYVAGLVKGVGLCGGALLAAADLAGTPSWSWRMANAREHRAAIREVKSRAKERR